MLKVAAFSFATAWFILALATMAYNRFDVAVFCALVGFCNIWLYFKFGKRVER